MHIVGTAGHVDHGKSALVAALTGTDPDRFPEERARGMTLDLGFAHLDLGDGIEAGIVDVPGHERFLHNMLAGAAGMEVLLLVVAANEGVKPQTLEHLQILRYLNVRTILVALTKMDTIEPHRGGEVCRLTHEQLRGTIAQDAYIFAVSSMTGYNLDVLTLALKQALAELPPRLPDAPPYLSIDRVFDVAGHGTVVTGTLMQGAIRVGETVRIEPGEQRARIRGIEVFGKHCERAEGGARVALNLVGADREHLARGAAIVGDHVEARTRFAVSFAPLADALPLMRRRTHVRVAIGSAEVLGTLVFDAAPADTTEHRAELHLRAPVAAFPGVRFIARGVTPKQVLGGGRIESAARVEGGVAAVLRASDKPLTTADVAAEANVREADAREQLDALVADGAAIRVARPAAYVDGERARALLRRVGETLEENERAHPWTLGLTSVALARELGGDEATIVRILGAFAEAGALRFAHGYYASSAHAPRLSDEQRALLRSVSPEDGEHPFVPASHAQALAAVKASRVPGASAAFDTALAHGELVRVGDSLYRGDQIAQARARVEAFLRAEGRMTPAQFRDVLGTSRKYALPLLEWFDACGVTLRNGDFRVLRKATGEGAAKEAR